MKIAYLIETKRNPIYNGAFAVNGYFKTYGQHSFIYDFITVGLRLGISFEMVVDDIHKFPLYPILSTKIKVRQLVPRETISSELIILDAISNSFLKDAVLKGLVVGINHNHLNKESEAFYQSSDAIICLTENGKKHQSKYVDQARLVVLRQGIDLMRFKEKEKSDRGRNVLIYSRMDSRKGQMYSSLVGKLLSFGFDVTVLGDGKYFWEIVDRYLNQITPVSYIPCYSIHKFIRNYDLIVSNGRGVMEGMACGIPTIAAGLKYGGLVNRDNIDFLFERNFTCSNVINELSDIEKDINKICSLPPPDNHLAKEYFDMSNFIIGIKKICQSNFS